MPGLHSIVSSAGRWLNAFGLVAGLSIVPALAQAADLTEPRVFASSGGVLDLLMIAKPQPIPSIQYRPPAGGAAINPIGWVYEICPRPADAPVCPAGGNTVADYGGVRLALQQGDSLKIRLVNQLPLLDPLKAKHTLDIGGANLFLNPTNIHTHGLIVPARTPTLADPTFGDFVFLEVYNSANGTPAPQAEHQHGSIKMDYADYRIDIPANHPSGSFWFHPHLHGLSLNQITGGLAGIITIGEPSSYIADPPSVVRHLILKDMQVVAGGTYTVDGGQAQFADGEVQYQESGDFCEAYGNKGPPASRQGLCEGEPPEVIGGNNYTGGRWFFPVNGQTYPTLHMTSPDGEVWRLTNASGQFSYKLSLRDSVTQAPMMMQLVSLDGVSINVPPDTPPGTIIRSGANRFTLASCPPSSNTVDLPVCVTDLAMMPSSRAEVWVTYRDANGNAAAPPPGAAAQLHQQGLDLGPAGEIWPNIELMNVSFEQTLAPARSAVSVNGNAKTALAPGGIFATSASKPAAPKIASARPAANCQPLAAGHRRRIFFGVEDPFDPDTAFGLGYEEVDENGSPVPGTLVPVSSFDPAVTRVCIPLGPNGAAVHETWELVSLATEIHNFHMHQTKFTVLEAPDLETRTARAASAPTASVIMEDNVPVPYSTTASSDVGDNQGGYCTIDQWRGGTCTAYRIVLDIPFSQLGDFVYHCHILEHEDGGMMAKIRVVSDPSVVVAAGTHDFDGDGASDILWRDGAGNVQMWLMNGGTLTSSLPLGRVANTWSIVGQRDFNGDGMSDLLWRENGGNVAIWLMNGATPLSISVLGVVPPFWTVVGTGDVNGDGKGDIVWRDAGGNVALWIMNGASVTTVANLGAVPVSWTVQGTADVDGDGKADIIWRDAAGNVAVWIMNGAAISAIKLLGNVPPAWSIVGTGDFNGDNNFDIFWRNVDGSTAVWLIQSGALLSVSSLGSIPANWSVTQTGDYGPDGRSDILWRDTTGNIAMWVMIAGTAASILDIGNVPVNWTIQGMNAD